MHELLYNTENFSGISFDEYFKQLIDRVQDTYQNLDRKVSNETQIHSYSANINQAIPLGLLLNELIANSYKHAFDGVDNPTISLEIVEKDGFLEIYNKVAFTDQDFETDTQFFIEWVVCIVLSSPYPPEESGSGFSPFRRESDTVEERQGDDQSNNRV